MIIFNIITRHDFTKLACDNNLIGTIAHCLDLSPAIVSYNVDNLKPEELGFREIDFPKWK